MRLYEIPGAMRLLADQMDESGGEMSPEMLAEFDRLTESFEQKAESVLVLSRELAGEAGVLDAEISRLQQMKKRKVNAAERWERYLIDAMKAARVTSIKTTIGKVTIQRAGRPAITWLKDELPPEEFTKIVPAETVLDKDKALVAFKEQGRLPDGFKVSYSEYLRIT